MHFALRAPVVGQLRRQGRRSWRPIWWWRLWWWSRWIVCVVRHEVIASGSCEWNVHSWLSTAQRPKENLRLGFPLITIIAGIWFTERSLIENKMCCDQCGSCWKLQNLTSYIAGFTLKMSDSQRPLNLW
jgi:hypothetical protein